MFSSLFEHVKVDECQVEAAEMIRQNPIVCVNGKGGCGKTTVVSAVFKHLESVLMDERLKYVFNIYYQRFIKSL